MSGVKSATIEPLIIDGNVASPGAADEWMLLAHEPVGDGDEKSDLDDDDDDFSQYINQDLRKTPRISLSKRPSQCTVVPITPRTQDALNAYNQKCAENQKEEEKQQQNKNTNQENTTTTTTTTTTDDNKNNTTQNKNLHTVSPPGPLQFSASHGGVAALASPTHKEPIGEHGSLKRHRNAVFATTTTGTAGTTGKDLSHSPPNPTTTPTIGVGATRPPRLSTSNEYVPYMPGSNTNSNSNNNNNNNNLASPSPIICCLTCKRPTTRFCTP
eukprot:UN03910